MGKRKLNGTSFYQCDWTGFPMKTPWCYMPEWTATGKLQKKGSFCNWEAVVAQASYNMEHDAITLAQYSKIIEHVTAVCGTTIEAAPHYTELAHVQGRMTMADFHDACARVKHPITGVKITPQGEVFEVILTGNEGKFQFSQFLHHPYNQTIEPHTFHSMRKKGQTADLSVWYYPAKDLPHNPTASNLFKMQLYGDVLLVMQSRESSFLPRERYVSFTKGQFDEQFNKRRKRHSDMQCMAPTVYAEVKAVMQEQLNDYERQAAQTAVAPADIARVLKPETKAVGKALADGARARSSTPSLRPPPQFRHPQPVA